MVYNLFPVPRDINERGRDLEQVLNQYMNFVKPAFEEFCLPVIIFLISKTSLDNYLIINYNAPTFSDQKIC